MPTSTARAAPGEATQQVARNIRAKREERGLTQIQVAEEVQRIGPPRQWGQSRVAKIESGHHKIFLDDIVLLAEVLECTPHDLLEGV